MEDLQKLLPGFPRVTPQAPFLQVTPNVNFMQNVLPRQNLQPTGQLEYKVRSGARVPAAGRAPWHVWGVCSHSLALFAACPDSISIKVYPLAVPFGCDSGWSLEKLTDEGKLQCQINYLAGEKQGCAAWCWSCRSQPAWQLNPSAGKWRVKSSFIPDAASLCPAAAGGPSLISPEAQAASPLLCRCAGR